MMTEPELQLRLEALETTIGRMEGLVLQCLGQINQIIGAWSKCVVTRKVTVIDDDGKLIASLDGDRFLGGLIEVMGPGGVARLHPPAPDPATIQT